MRPTKMAKRRTWAEGQEVSPSSSWAALGMSHGLQGLSFPFCKMEIQPCPALHPPGTWSERETGVTGLVRPDSGKNSLRTWEELWFRGLVGAQEPRGDEEVVEANTQLREPEQSRRKVQLGAPWQRPGDGRGPGGGVDHRQAGRLWPGGRPGTFDRNPGRGRGSGLQPEAGSDGVADMWEPGRNQAWN